MSMTTFTHGHSTNSRLYRCWQSMKARCDNPSNTKYANYGGRGITYQSSWKNFEGFLRDMGDSYYEHAHLHGDKNTTLDRISSDRLYSEKNCRWATRAEQTRNRKTSIYYKGEYSCDAAIRLGGDIDSVNVRLRHGWSLKKAFTTPFSKTRLMNKYKYKGFWLVFGAVISQNWGALKRPDHFSSPWLLEKNRVGQLG